MVTRVSESAGSRFSERLRNAGQRAIRKTLGVDIWLPHALQHIHRYTNKIAAATKDSSLLSCRLPPIEYRRLS